MAVRAINSAGTATTGIVVDGVSLGDAVAGYTTLLLAIAASSNGDTIVYTEDGEQAVHGSITTALTGIVITADDSVRFTGGAYGTGARQKAGAYHFSVTAGGSVTIKNLGWRKTAQGTLMAGGAGASLTLQRMVMLYDNLAGYTMIYDSSAGASITIDNCRIEVTVQGGNTRAIYCLSTDYAVSVFNTTIVYTSSAGTAVSLVRGATAALRVACANVQALRTNAASVPSVCFLNATAHPSYTAGNNMSSKTDAPGTTVYNSVIADDILAGVSPLDMRWKDRTTAELYPGVDVSATISDYDADFQARNDEWFVGADWIAATVAAVASASSIGFFLMSPFGMLFGLQDE